MSPEAILQLRYTELLEKRIAQLESVIDATAKAVAQPGGEKEESAKVTNGEVKTGEGKNEDKKEGTANGEDASKTKVNKTNLRQVNAGIC
jgi:hypothetical protein